MFYSLAEREETDSPLPILSEIPDKDRVSHPTQEIGSARGKFSKNNCQNGHNYYCDGSNNSRNNVYQTKTAIMFVKKFRN